MDHQKHSEAISEPIFESLMLDSGLPRSLEFRKPSKDEQTRVISKLERVYVAILKVSHSPEEVNEVNGVGLSVAHGCAAVSSESINSRGSPCEASVVFIAFHNHSLVILRVSQSTQQFEVDIILDFDLSYMIPTNSRIPIAMAGLTQ